MYRTVFWTLWERARVGWFGRIALKHVNYHLWNESPVQVRCMRQGARGWCTGMTQRDGMGREVGGGFRMGNTCTPMADSCQCMAKPIQYCKVKNKKKRKKTHWICYIIASILCFGFLASVHVGSTRNWIHTPCIGSPILEYWTARGTPPWVLKQIWEGTRTECITRKSTTYRNRYGVNIQTCISWKLNSYIINPIFLFHPAFIFQIKLSY